MIPGASLYTSPTMQREVWLFLIEWAAGACGVVIVWACCSADGLSIYAEGPPESLAHWSAIERHLSVWRPRALAAKAG